MPLQSLTHAAGRWERRFFSIRSRRDVTPAASQNSKLKASAYILISIRCAFSLRCLASLRAKGPLSSVLSRADLADLGCGIPAFFPFPVFFSAFPGVILVRYASQSRSVFPQKVRICDIFRGFPSRYVPLKSVFLAESPPNCRFSACFALCNALSFSVELGK